MFTKANKMTHSGTPQLPNLSVFIMAYNEASNVLAVCLELLHELREMECNFEIVIIDDGSTDNTWEEVQELVKSHREVSAVRHRRNLGLSEVYHTGFRKATGDLLTFFPADGQFPASILRRFLRAISQQDMVLGFLENGRDTFLGQILTYLEKKLYQICLGSLPRFQGVLMFRHHLLEKIPLKTRGRGHAVIMELILKAKRHGYRVKSTPTPVRPRLSGKSKVANLSTIFSNVAQLLSLTYQTRVSRNGTK